MAAAQDVQLYLEEPFRHSAARGEHNFINLVVDVLQRAGHKASFHALPHGDVADGSYSLSHMVQPPDEKGLVFRRVYHYPFWQIDAVAQRWQWDVARAHFDPAAASGDAPRFYKFWQKRLFGDAVQNITRKGFVYVPLQGNLRRTRVFQTCAPLEMVEHCLEQDSARQIIATLHPNESYSVADLASLDALARKHPRLRIDTGNMQHYLQTCDYIVTQNSAVAFSGFFFGKPTLLFAQIDFHHICETADMAALPASFAQVQAATPPFAKYIWWFWQDQSINAGRKDARAKIAARLRRFDWPIPNTV